MSSPILGLKDDHRGLSLYSEENLKSPELKARSQMRYTGAMNADAMIEQLQKLPPEEVERVGRFIEDYRAELEADRIAAGRDREIDEGKVRTLSHEEVFGRFRFRGK